jgi:predicted component of type VI protein secretion system
LLAYEPRLQNPRVLVMGLDARQRSVLISILGVLRIGRVEEPFSFACALDQASQAPVGVGDTYAA